MIYRISLYFALSLTFLACQETPKEMADTFTAAAAVTIPHAPASFNKVLDAHGGLATWQSQQSMSYVVAAKGETHKIDLPSRKILLENEKYTIGYDGKDVWLKQDSAYYSGSARFYHNLYFYFITMPFVLADPGIRYEELAPLSFEGLEYPGIKIAYEANVGDSPDDNYILYYHPETYQMTWLAYTVTYQSKAPSDNFRLIRYSDWKTVNGNLLPHQLQWYDYKEGVIGEPSRDPMVVSELMLSGEAMDGALFVMPAGAEVVVD